MSAISGISGNNINNYLAVYQAGKADSLRQADSDIRTQAIRQASAAGVEGTVVTNLQYTVGPDGQLYATGGTVSTQKRVSGPENFSRIESKKDVGQQPANDNRGSTQRRELTFADIINPQLDVSSADFAALFSEDIGENIAQSKLQLADVGTRAHERSHFFSAGGLASGTPNYDYATGPDGELYAVAGDVRVSTTPTTDPEKASRDAAGIALAATAAGDASAQDLKVAKNSSGKAASLYNDATFRNNDRLFNLAA